VEKIKFVYISVLIVCGFVLVKKADDREMLLVLNEVQNEDKSIVQWEDENFGESICKAFGKDKVTYTDIEYVTGIDIDSQYVVRVYSENKENEYIFKTNDGECVMLAPQEFTTLDDLKKFPNLRKLYLNECRVENNEALGELEGLEQLNLDKYAIDSLDVLERLTALTDLTVSGVDLRSLQPLTGMTEMKNLWLSSDNITDIDDLSGLVNLEELVLYGNQIEDISSLRNLKKLTKLNLDENLIEDVEPLADLTNLKELYLQDNPIKNMDSLRNLTGTEIRN
jgi:hypothetical protein